MEEREIQKERDRCKLWALKIQKDRDSNNVARSFIHQAWIENEHKQINGWGSTQLMIFRWRTRKNGISSLRMRASGSMSLLEDVGNSSVSVSIENLMDSEALTINREIKNTVFPDITKTWKLHCDHSKIHIPIGIHKCAGQFEKINKPSLQNDSLRNDSRVNRHLCLRSTLSIIISVQAVRWFIGTERKRSDIYICMYTNRREFPIQSIERKIRLQISGAYETPDWEKSCTIICNV